ncbi:carbohydrate ABC transporter permease [Parafrankia sp. BMG5.11]|uniref:carbohydrate ABC transporter permease n=1 Tax=Parafrankia TaxID=2994362 RepID=UPI0028A423AF|nr:Trehalose transport system permease protein SugA [Frankia sp. Hr75.2]
MTANGAEPGARRLSERRGQERGDVRSPSEPGTRRKAPLSARARAERRLGWALCAPAVVVILAVTGYPVGYAVYLSLHRYDLRFPADSEFVGLTNYATVLTSPLWWQALAVTVIIAVISVAIQFVLGLALALAMHRALIGRGLIRTVILIPYGIVTVVAAFGWRYAWTPDTGYLSGLFGDAAPLTSQVHGIAVIVLAEVWKTTPFMALLLLAGLALVPEDLLRAAKVDGATAWQRLTRVILPLMKPAILVALLFRVLDAFRIFDSIYVLTAGAYDTRSVSILGYDNLFTALNLGVGSSLSVLIFLVVALVAFVFVKGFGAAAPGGEGHR